MYNLDLDPRLCALEDRLNDPVYQQPINNYRPILADDITKFAINANSWKEVAIEMNVGYNKLLYSVRKYKMNNLVVYKRNYLPADKIINAISSNKSWKEISKDLDISMSRLFYWIRKHKIEKPKVMMTPFLYKWTRTKKISREQFMTVYSPNKPLRVLARELETTGQRVKRIIKMLKLDHNYLPCGGLKMDISKEDFMKAFSLEKKWEEIALDLNISLSKATKLAKEFNIKKPRFRKEK